MTNNISSYNRVPELDSEGHSIITWKFLQAKVKMSPWPRPIIIDEDYK
jgi:hypothetical protein